MCESIINKVYDDFWFPIPTLRKITFECGNRKPEVIFLSDNKYQCIDLPDMAICPNNGFMIKQWCPGQDQVCHSCNSTTYSINIPLAILFISHEQYSVKYVELQMVKNSNGQKIDGIFLPI